MLATVGILTGMLACSDPELPVANLNATATAYKATFTFANATADAPSLDFFVNGVNLGTAARGTGLPLVTSLPLISNGSTGSVLANTAIRAKATSGTIGGKLDLVQGPPEAKHLIYRSASNGTNNFAAINGGNYTAIAIDSIGRPIPPRLNRKTATISFADFTYWNPNNKLMISASRRDSLNPANCRTKVCTTCTGCVNWDTTGFYLDPTKVQNPSTTIEFANLVTIGLVPLGLTDPGGVRFSVLTDTWATFTAGTVVTNAGIRFVNAIPNSNNVTAVANANGTFGGPPVYARLNGGTTLNLTGVVAPNATNAFVGSVVGGFSPTLGSRTFGNLTFGNLAIAVAGVPNAYTLQLATDAAFTNIVYSAPVTFAPGKNYTIVARGYFKILDGPPPTLIGLQPTISHVIITH